MINNFKNLEHYKSFVKNGYTLLQEVLSKEDIIYLKEYYRENISQPIKNNSYGMYISLDEPNINYRTKTVEDLQRFLSPKLNHFLTDIKFHLGSFLIKVPNPQSFTFPHQDWLFVDHNKTNDLYSATIWISLEDITPESGSLGFIKGSHIFLNNIVGSPSPQLKTATMGHEGLLLSYLDFPNVKAGDALIFNNKTVHAAFPNSGNFDRMAVGIGITPKEAKLHHYFLKPGTTDKIYKFEVDSSFFVENVHDQLRDYYIEGIIPQNVKIIDELNYQPKLFESKELEKTMIEYGNKKNNSPLAESFVNFRNSNKLSKLKIVFKSILSRFFFKR